MKKKSVAKISETDLYQPIHDFFVKQGYTVRSEVNDCDITALKDDELVVVELKTSLNLELLVQGVKRQRAADIVYVAVPRPKKGIYTARWKGVIHLLRRLELGLILVSFTTGKAAMEVALQPVPFDRARSFQQGRRTRKGIIREMEGRNGDYNLGGSSRRKLMTAYRENAIQIACILSKLGSQSPSNLRRLGACEKTQSILNRNVYGWFEKEGRGQYGLSCLGKECLNDYPELVEYYMKQLDANISLKT